MNFPDARIVVFCKAPVPGAVKTRLAKHIGDIAAAQLHECLTHHCLQSLTSKSVAPIQLWCAPNTDHAIFAECRDLYGVELYEQEGADLGERMRHAVECTLAAAKHCVLVGTDCPAMDGAVVQEAMTALSAGSDGVITPTEDGGYVLLGMSRVMPELFDDISWSSAHVLAQTRAKMSGTWRELATLWDIDRIEDLQRLKASVGQWPLNRRLMEYLETIDL